ncbi:MAG TPA: inositol monophosphatase family protein [Verrucomicrobiae bacterium]|nr:inositol monophosphatase family protein [Verrucomicrobiae bacterium]
MLETAIEAANEAGKLLRKNFGSALNVNQATHHDIKLEIDEQSQKLITRVILADFPDHCILGEEAVTGNPDTDVRWVVDPLDGTVNYFYGIPHYAVSIAAQIRKRDARATEPQWETVVGVVLDPELDELFISEKGEPAMLHGYPIRVSERTELSEAIVAVGFFKSVETINRSLRDFGQMIHKVRKLRLMGAAALDVVYVACGRYDAYIEYGIKLWDIAAGQLILQNAGGRTESKPSGEGVHAYDVRMWNGRLPVNALAD